MATKLAELMAEMTALDNSLSTKTASVKKTADDNLADVLEKLSFELDSHEDKESDEEEDKEEKDEKKDKKENPFAKKDEKKEGSRKNTMGVTMLDQATLSKLAAAVTNQVMANLTKIAVDGSELTPGMPQASAGSPKSETGVLLQAIEEERKDNAAPTPGSDDMVTTPTADLIEGQAPTPAPEKLQKGASVTYTAEESEVLNKLASIGYDVLVDKMSDDIVQEKIASAIVAEQAAAAPQKIARQIINGQNQKTAAANYNQTQQLVSSIAQNYLNAGYSQNDAVKLATVAVSGQAPVAPRQSARDKLASAAQNDPAVLQALKVLNSRGLM